MKNEEKENQKNTNQLTDYYEKYSNVSIEDESAEFGKLIKASGNTSKVVQALAES